MKAFYLFEQGDKIVITKTKEGGRWNDEGLMDEYLGKTLVVEKAYIEREGNPYYACVGVLSDEDRSWLFFDEMIDKEESIKANKAE